MLKGSIINYCCFKPLSGCSNLDFSKPLQQKQHSKGVSGASLLLTAPSYTLVTEPRLHEGSWALITSTQRRSFRLSFPTPPPGYSEMCCTGMEAQLLIPLAWSLARGGCSRALPQSGQCPPCWGNGRHHRRSGTFLHTPAQHWHPTTCPAKACSWRAAALPNTPTSRIRLGVFFSLYWISQQNVKKK